MRRLLGHGICYYYFKKLIFKQFSRCFLFRKTCEKRAEMSRDSGHLKEAKNIAAGTGCDRFLVGSQQLVILLQKNNNHD